MTTSLSDCDDTTFHFQAGWSYTAMIIVLICGFSVFVDAIRHKEKRKVPGILMMSRTAVDVIWAILFFYMILDVDCALIHRHPKRCDTFSTMFTFLFLLSLMYFGGICWDMYFTLVNPFRKPISDSWQLHLLSIIVSLSLALIVFFDHGYQYRKDYQICWTKNTSTETSPNNLIVLYIPLGAVIFGGIGITIWAVRRLKQRMLEETFELRWSVIKRQIAIVSFFTLNYVIAGCIWLPIVMITFDTDEDYGEYGAKPDTQPYLLSITIVLTVCFDLVAWIAKDSFESCSIFRNPIKIISSSHNNNDRPIIEYNIANLTNNNPQKATTPKSSISKSFNAINRDEKAEPLLLNQSNSSNHSHHSSMQSSLSNNNNNNDNSNISLLDSNNSSVFSKNATNKILNKKAPNLSNALRREVIVFITHGLAQAIRRTAKETQDIKTANDNNLDVWDADFDNVYSNQSITNRRKSNKSNADDLQNYDDDEDDEEEEEEDEEDGEDEEEEEHRYYHDYEEDEDGRYDINGNNQENDDNNFDYLQENVLNIIEPPPQKVYFPYSIRKNPAEHRGAMDRFNIKIPGSKGDDVPFTDFAPHVFRYLRTTCYGVSDKKYLESILPDNSEQIIGDIVAKFSEGRSGAFFFYTKDNKYLIKTLHFEEAQLLLQILPNYKDYYLKNPGSYLAKFFGLHSIKLYSLVIFFVIMENVFPPNTEPQETYDLKGSWIARHTNHHSDEGKLMKDEDLHKQLLLNNNISSSIYYQLYKDSEFLEKRNIMDYSLLLGIYYMGIDPEKIEKSKINMDDLDDDDNDDNKYDDNKDNLSGSHRKNNISNNTLIMDQHNHFYRTRAETYHTVMRTVGNDQTAIKAKMIEGPGIYYIGVIDILQKWNASKRLERLFKVYFRCMNKKGVSCVEPSFYRRRFLKKMEFIGIRPNQRRTSSKKYV